MHQSHQTECEEVKRGGRLDTLAVEASVTSYRKRVRSLKELIAVVRVMAMVVRSTCMHRAYSVDRFSSSTSGHAIVKTPVMIRNLNDAQSQKARTQKTASRCARHAVAAQLH